MVIKKMFSIAIVDIEKIAEINNIIIRYTPNLQQYSTYSYLNLDLRRAEDTYMDITLFQLESDSESGLNRKLDELIRELNQLNTLYAIRDEDSQEMVVEIEHVIALNIKFGNVKFLKEGTFEKIDEMNHLKTEFGICKNYYPIFRPLENTSIENKAINPETIYLFSDSAENLSKLKTWVSEKIMEINPDFEIEFTQFRFRD